MQYFKNIANTATSFLEGMAVTLSWMFRRPYTVQWPDKIEKDLEGTLPARFRGILEVETRICIACLACMKECPIGVIAITVDRNAETKERTDHAVRRGREQVHALRTLRGGVPDRRDPPHDPVRRRRRRCSQARLEVR